MNVQAPLGASTVIGGEHHYSPLFGVTTVAAAISSFGDRVSIGAIGRTMLLEGKDMALEDQVRKMLGPKLITYVRIADQLGEVPSAVPGSLQPFGINWGSG